MHASPWIASTGCMQSVLILISSLKTVSFAIVLPLISLVEFVENGCKIWSFFVSWSLGLLGFPEDTSAEVMEKQLPYYLELL